ncbi:MAG: hypothetical protein M1816_005896 [Peltula sp. TS41687]|nr:MAG: hypothetical protein M1816_005896 [Peltula sp. TS41687]
MATLSVADIIKKYPIGRGLDGFRASFSSTCAELDVPISPEALRHFSPEDFDGRVLDLFLALQNLSAARYLSSPNGQGVLLRGLALLISDAVDVDSVAPLVEKVIRRAADEDIWKAVISLVSQQTTPPTLLNQRLPRDTPLRSTSSSQQGSEQTHDEIDPRILQEINGCVYQNTNGFNEKYFEGKPWSKTVKDILHTVSPRIVDGRWTEYPNPPSQKAFLEWFWNFRDRFIQGIQGTCGTYDTSHSTPLAGSDWKRQPDLFFIHSRTTKRDGKYNWADLRVIVELKQSENPKKFKEELVWFCGYAREVFKYQPTRRFLHGCFIRGSILEPWVLDRSGLYSGAKIDVHKDPNQFIRVIASYALMSDNELGFNTYIKEDKVGKYILFRGDDEKKEGELYLEDRPIAFQRAIVCRGTTCYRAKRPNSERWEFVVKFSWRSDKRRAEGDLLRLAKERNVWGVARLFGHQDLETIADLRQGLGFGEPRSFRSATGNSFSESHTGSVLSGLGFSQHHLSSTSGRKRKRCGDTAFTRTKQSRSESSCRWLDLTQIVKEQYNAPEETRYSIEQPNSTNVVCLTSPINGSFDNRIFSCLVISPPGRPLHEFQSVKEFLEACRDIVRALKSLYQEGKILHRDISKNNLIIPDGNSEGEPKGMLIDLDLAKELDSGPSGARHRTGTMEFMAIEVLESTAHTYRHDLESFFYVILWIVIEYGQEDGPGLPETSRLRRWYKGTYDEIAQIKRGLMDKTAFKKILAEFPPKFVAITTLAEELRRILFPIREESLFTGTYRDTDKLYQLMIEAFDKTIAKHTDIELDQKA